MSVIGKEYKSPTKENRAYPKVENNTVAVIFSKIRITAFLFLLIKYTGSSTFREYKLLSKNTIREIKTQRFTVPVLLVNNENILYEKIYNIEESIELNINKTAILFNTVPLSENFFLL